MTNGGIMVCSSSTLTQGRAVRCYLSPERREKSIINVALCVQSRVLTALLYSGCDSWVTEAAMNNSGYIELWSKSRMACKEHAESWGVKRPRMKEEWFRRGESRKNTPEGKDGVHSPKWRSLNISGFVHDDGDVASVHFDGEKSWTVSYQQKRLGIQAAEMIIFQKEAQDSLWDRAQTSVRGSK